MEENDSTEHPPHNYWWRSAWITGRRNLIYALLKKINIDKDSRLLDVGCGHTKYFLNISDILRIPVFHVIKCTLNEKTLKRKN